MIIGAKEFLKDFVGDIFLSPFPGQIYSSEYFSKLDLKISKKSYLKTFNGVNYFIGDLSPLNQGQNFYSIEMKDRIKYWFRQSHKDYTREIEYYVFKKTGKVKEISKHESFRKLSTLEEYYESWGVDCDD